MGKQGKKPEGKMNEVKGIEKSTKSPKKVDQKPIPGVPKTAKGEVKPKATQVPKKQAEQPKKKPVQDPKKETPAPKPAQPKAAASDIDDIFATKKKQPVAKKQAPARTVPDKDSEKEEIWQDSRGDKAAQRKVVDGLKVYTYEELGISADSGGTADCPFDCNCCF